MPYCSSCGAQIDDNTRYCPKCGSPVGQVYRAPAQPPYQYVNDTGSVGWALLGFLIPLVGLILFLVWIDNKPKCAKMAGLGALLSVLFWVIILPLGFIIAMAAASASVLL